MVVWFESCPSAARGPSPISRPYPDTGKDPTVRCHRRHCWIPINYPRAVWMTSWCWVSDAQVAETSYTAFNSRKGQAVAAGLIVRRVKTSALEQGELLPAAVTR